MELQKPLYLFFFLLLTLLSSSQAKKLNVGGSQGWVPNPSESYNNWAGRNRFQINDTIVFNYKKGSDSVLEVKKDDYDKCNKTSPIKKFENGDTEFKFDRSGPFYFVSGKDGNCEKGQKLIVVVLSPRTPPKQPSSPPTPSPSPSFPPKPSPSPSPKPNPPTVSPSSSPSPAVQPPPDSPPAPPPDSPPAPPPDSPPAPPPPPPPEMGTPPQSPQGPTSPPRSAPSNSTALSPTSDGFSVAPSIVLVYSVTIAVGAALFRY